MNTSIPDYIINNNAKSKIVYCRLGEKYIVDLEKRKNSTLAQSNQATTNFATFAYLINIKKLIDEHNINGEKKDFKAMKSLSMGKKMEPEP